MIETFGEPKNKIDPFSQEEVQSLGDDKLVLSNGDLTVAVSGEYFLAFVKNEIERRRSLNDMVLHFTDAPSLNLNSVDLSSQVWAACHIREDNCKFLALSFDLHVLKKLIHWFCKFLVVFTNLGLILVICLFRCIGVDEGYLQSPSHGDKLQETPSFLRC